LNASNISTYYGVSAKGNMYDANRYIENLEYRDLNEKYYSWEDAMNHAMAGDGSVHVDGATSNLYNLRVDGGRGGWWEGNYYAGGGAGGRIFIGIIDQKATVKKTITPVTRLGTPGNETFNPYALQKGDRIAVHLLFSNLIPGNLHVEEEMLTVPYANPAIYCNLTPLAGGGGYNLYDMVTGQINPISYENRKVIFDITIPSGVTEREVYYWCDVN